MQKKGTHPSKKTDAFRLLTGARGSLKSTPEKTGDAAMISCRTNAPSRPF